MPKASAWPECISSAFPGANPMPCQRASLLLAITHGKLLWWVFCTEALLTIKMGCSELHSNHSWWTWQVHWIGPKRGYCHGLKECLNWWVSNLNYWSFVHVVLGASRAMTGKSTHHWCMSNSVTGCPVKLWFIGTVSKKVSKWKVCWMRIASCGLELQVGWYSRLPQGDIYQSQQW